MDIISGKEIPATFLVRGVEDNRAWGDFKIGGKVISRCQIELNYLEDLIDPVKKINKLEKQKQEIEQQINKLRQENV